MIKRDSNEAPIVAALRAAGCAVQLLHGNTAGVADLLVCCRGRLYLLEVKAPKGKLSPGQTAWHRLFPVTVVTTVEQALGAVGLLRGAA
jgi:hypothetical protein